MSGNFARYRTYLPYRNSGEQWFKSSLAFATSVFESCASERPQELFAITITPSLLKPASYCGGGRTFGEMARNGAGYIKFRKCIRPVFLLIFLRSPVPCNAQKPIRFYYPFGRSRHSGLCRWNNRRGGLFQTPVVL